MTYVEAIPAQDERRAGYRAEARVRFAASRKREVEAREAGWVRVVRAELELQATYANSIVRLAPIAGAYS